VGSRKGFRKAPSQNGHCTTLCGRDAGAPGGGGSGRQRRAGQERGRLRDHFRLRSSCRLGADSAIHQTRADRGQGRRTIGCGQRAGRAPTQCTVHREPRAGIGLAGFLLGVRCTHLSRASSFRCAIYLIGCILRHPTRDSKLLQGFRQDLDEAYGVAAGLLRAENDRPPRVLDAVPVRLATCRCRTAGCALMLLLEIAPQLETKKYQPHLLPPHPNTVCQAGRGKT